MSLARVQFMAHRPVFLGSDNRDEVSPVVIAHNGSSSINHEGGGVLMKSHRMLVAFLAAAGALCTARTPVLNRPALYIRGTTTGNAAPSIENWVKDFGTNTVTLDNSVLGELRIVETGTPGEDVAISDGVNRVRESATGASGGTDVTGLD